MRIKLSRKVVILTFTGLLLCAVASEVALRFLFGLGNPITVTNDPSCGYIVSPNQHKMRFGREVDINRYGMRSRPVSWDKGAACFRILLVGDSILYGTSRVGQSEIFASLLGRELPTMLARKVETLNASASAWAIANETGYIRSRGLFRSNLVLLVLNTGDLAQPEASVDDVADLPSHKYACAWCEVWDRAIRPRLSHRFSAHQDAGTEVKIDPGRVAINLNLLENFRSIVANAHSRMAILFVAFRRNVAEGAQRSAPDELVRWAAERQIPLLDLTQFESGIPAAKLTLDGVHLSTVGNRVVATAIEKNWSRLNP